MNREERRDVLQKPNLYYLLKGTRLVSKRRILINKELPRLN
jgi:hypothetical protein